MIRLLVIQEANKNREWVPFSMGSKKINISFVLHMVDYLKDKILIILQAELEQPTLRHRLRLPLHLASSTRQKLEGHLPAQRKGWKFGVDKVEVFGVNASFPEGAFGYGF